jgi:hypothetical protein
MIEFGVLFKINRNLAALQTARLALALQENVARYRLQ